MCRNPQEKLGFHRPLYYTALGKYLRAFSVREGKWGEGGELKGRTGSEEGRGRDKGKQGGCGGWVENACGVCV